jgi:hypothetical protein
MSAILPYPAAPARQSSFSCTRSVNELTTKFHSLQECVEPIKV